MTLEAIPLVQLHGPGLAGVAPEVSLLVSEHAPWDVLTPSPMTFALYLSSNDSNSNHYN